MNIRGTTKMDAGVGLLYSNRGDETMTKEIALPELSTMCSVETAPLRHKTDIVQFKTVGRTGEQLLYHNTYQAPNPGNDRGVVATTTYRVRLFEEEVVDAQSHVNYTSERKDASVNSIVVMKAQKNLKRLQSMDRAFNKKLDQTTRGIVRFIEGRTKTTIAKLTVEYSIDPDGTPIFSDARNISTFAPKVRNKRAELPRRIRIAFGDIQGNSSQRLATTTNRSLQFHTRNHETYQDVSPGSSEGAITLAHSKAKVIKVHRKSCHGDFCSFVDKNSQDQIGSEDLSVESSEAKPAWTRQNAIKAEWKKTSKQMDKVRQQHKEDIVSSVRATIIRSGSKFDDDNDESNHNERPSTTESFEKPRKTVKNKKHKSYPLAFRMIANARIDTQYMPDELTRWYMTNRANTRRGDGPWIHVIAPINGKKYNAGRSVRCVWEWAGIIGCAKIQLFLAFNKVHDVVMSTKNDGLYVFEIPTGLYEGAESHMHGNMWRLKVSDTSNPNIFSYSSRFSIQDPSRPEERRNRAVDKRNEADSKYLDLMQDLDRDEIELTRVSRKLAGMTHYLNSVKQNNHVPASLKYSQITVCRQCYLVYNRLELRKRDCNRLKDAGCRLDDLGQVIGGEPPTASLQIRPLDEARLEKQMKVIVDGPDVERTLKKRPNAVVRHQHIVQKRERKELKLKKVNDICIDIETNLARGLGVSQTRLKDFEDAYALALKAGVTVDNSSIRNADFLKLKLKRLNRIRSHTKFDNGSGMFRKNIGPSSAWEANPLVPINLFDDDISEESDDEPLLAPTEKSFNSIMRNAPTLPPAVSVGPRRKGWTLVSGLAAETKAPEDQFVAPPTEPTVHRKDTMQKGTGHQGKLTRKGNSNSYIAPTRSSTLRTRKKAPQSYSAANLPVSKKTTKKKPRAKKSLTHARSTASIDSRYENIIPLLEARGAGARDFKLSKTAERASPKKKIPWSTGSETFDASSPAGERQSLFGEPPRQKRKKTTRKQRMHDARSTSFKEKTGRKYRSNRLKKKSSITTSKRNRSGKPLKHKRRQSKKRANMKLMPTEIRHDAALRKVVCVLVLGQLADIRHLLRVYSANGTRGLSQSFPAEEQHLDLNESPSKKVSWLLENFVCCANVFASIFAPFDSRRNRSQERFLNTIGVYKGADIDPSVPWSSETVTRDAVKLVKQFLRWFNVGMPRCLIFEGIAHWVSGSVMLAHQKWKQAAVEAKRSTGVNSYDAAVAYFLIGRHSDIKTSALDRKKALRKALVIFRQLNGEAKEEESVLEVELKIPQKPKVDSAARANTFTPPSETSYPDRVSPGNMEVTKEESDTEPGDSARSGIYDNSAYENFLVRSTTQESASSHILGDDRDFYDDQDSSGGMEVNQTSLKDLWNANTTKPTLDHGLHSVDKYQEDVDDAFDGEMDEPNYGLDNPATPESQIYSAAVPPPTAEIEAIMNAPITPSSTAGTMYGPPMTPGVPSTSGSSTIKVNTMYGPITPGYGPITPEDSGSVAGYGPVTPGYEYPNAYNGTQQAPPATADVAAIMNAPITPGVGQGPVTPGYEFQEGYNSSPPAPPATADVAAIMNAPITPGTANGSITPGYNPGNTPNTPGFGGPITPGYDTMHNSTHMAPATADVAEIMNAPITPEFVMPVPSTNKKDDDLSLVDGASMDSSGIKIKPLYKEQSNVPSLPPLHSQEAELRVRKMKANALDELRQNFRPQAHESDSEDSVASTIRDLREKHEDDVKVLKVKLQSERRRQRSSLQRKLGAENSTRVNLEDGPNQEGQLSIVRTDSTSEVATLKTRLLRERERQRETMKRKLEARRRNSQKTLEQVGKAANAAYTFYSAGETSSAKDVAREAPRLGEIETSEVTGGPRESLRKSGHFNTYEKPASPVASDEAIKAPSPKKKPKKLLSARLENNMAGILFKMVLQQKTLALNAMLDAGSDVFVRNEAGNTLLIEAAKNDDMDMMHMLIAHGGKELLDTQNFEGSTALHYIFEREDPIGASFLIANGADETICNMYGLPARDGVTLKNFKELKF
jgi:hypothetical protein